MTDPIETPEAPTGWHTTADGTAQQDDLVAKAKAGAAEAVEVVKREAPGVVDRTTEVIGQAAEKVQAELPGAVEKGKEAASTVAEKVGPSVSSAATKVGQELPGVVDRTTEVLDSAAGKLMGFLNKKR